MIFYRQINAVARLAVKYAFIIVGSAFVLPEVYRRSLRADRAASLGSGCIAACIVYIRGIIPAPETVVQHKSYKDNRGYYQHP